MFSGKYARQAFDFIDVLDFSISVEYWKGEQCAGQEYMVFSFLIVMGRFYGYIVDFISILNKY